MTTDKHPLESVVNILDYLANDWQGKDGQTVVNEEAGDALKTLRDYITQDSERPDLRKGKQMTPIEKVRARLKELDGLSKGWISQSVMGSAGFIHGVAVQERIKVINQELEGMVIVPIEPTDEMINSALHAFSMGTIGDVWEAMIAPYLPKEGE